MFQQNKAKYVAPGIVMLAGLFAFGLVVIADSNTSSTSVVVSNATPTLSVNFNDGNNVTLVEGTFKYATATLTITDGNGCATINHISALARLASTSAAASYVCADDDAKCYNTGSTTVRATACMATTSAGNTCTGGVDTGVIYDCGFKLWYIAQATDSTAPVWATSIWSVSATTSDGLATTTATNTAQLVEFNVLNALAVNSTIDYGTIAANADSGATNSTTTATTTGNTPVDADISGTDMTSTPNTLAVGQQCYKAAAFTWASSCTGSVQLTTGATALELGNANPTSTTSPPNSAISWGVGIPAGQANGTYTGTNNVDARAD